MEFHSTEVQRASLLFQTVSFGDARLELDRILRNAPLQATRVEAMALSLRIDVERYEPKELESFHSQALELVSPACQLKLGASLFHLGIVFLICEDIDSSERCFGQFSELAQKPLEKLEAEYGKAAIAYNRKESETALGILAELAGSLRRDQHSSDLSCLVEILRGNCYRSLGRYEESLQSYVTARGMLPYARAFYLKNWVFHGLATLHVRRGDLSTARTLFETVLAITHPVEFRRLHKLAIDEMTRLEMKAEVLFDPVTGDIISNRGCLTLRRKPTLMALFSTLIEYESKSVTKEELYQRVWDGEYHPLRHDGLIYSHMQRLRQIVGADANLKDLILTTQEGYRLNPGIGVRLRVGGPSARNCRTELHTTERQEEASHEY